MSAHPGMHDSAPGLRAVRWNIDWILRPVFGIVMAVIAIVALFHGPRTFALLTAAIGIAAGFEWHRLVSHGKPYKAEAAITGAALFIATVALSMKVVVIWPLVAIAVGAVGCAVVAARRGGSPLWNGLGAVYLGLPSLALVALRLTGHGAMAIVGLFLIVWATDTGALICGNLIGGPRMAPVLSPSKTWAGTIGGSLTAALVFGGFIAFLAGSFWPAFAFAFVLSFIAHGGDLFESFVKRRFGVKDSGVIIPGHGGVLDRMDSTLAAAPALALLVFVFHFSPLIGVHG